MSSVYEKMSAVLFLNPGVQGICLKDNNGVIDYVEWPVGLTKPTDAQIEQAVLDQAVLVSSEKNNRKGRKRQLLDALATLTGLTRKQVLKCFMEIAQDGNDD